MNYEEELIKFELLIGMDDIDNDEFDEATFKEEVKDIYAKNYGENVTPLFLNS